MQARALLWELLEVLQKKGNLAPCLPDLSCDAIATLVDSEWSLPLEVRLAVLTEAGRRQAAAGRDRLP